jgi:protein tyrosine/serine phosphatase
MVLRLLFLIGAANCLLAGDVPARGLPVTEGILNFGKISDRLYRGAQPDSEGVEHLKKLGVKLVINLRQPGDCWKDESAAVIASGIQYTNFPMSGFGRPKDEQVRQILALLESFPGPVFLHCQHGCDRTGTVVACYRIQHDHWDINLAMREAERYGISPFEYGLRRYVHEFARIASQFSPRSNSEQARAN